MQGILHEEPSILQFLLITCIIGGWTAWRTGKSVADGWQTYTTVVVYTLLLGVAIRFVHHALFGGTMFSLHYYLVDTIILLLFSTRRLPVLPNPADDHELLLALRKSLAFQLEGKMKGTPAGFRRIKRHRRNHGGCCDRSDTISPLDRE